jgi:hypothetical protein
MTKDSLLSQRLITIYHPAELRVFMHYSSSNPMILWGSKDEKACQSSESVFLKMLE